MNADRVTIGPVMFQSFQRLSVLSCASIAVALVAPRAAAESAAEWAPDRVIIKLRERSSGSALRSGPLGAREWATRLGLPPGVTLQSMRASLTTQVASEHFPDLSRPAILHLNGQATVREILDRLQAHPDIEFAEPDYIGYGGGRPSDPSYSYQWHHEKIQSEAAWDISTGTADVIVAVLDTGLNASLLEFAGRIMAGHDYANDDLTPADDYGHGTAVTGVLAANANNGVLGAGLNWHCRILPEKVLDKANRGYYSWWTQAIYEATDAGAKVINLSAGGSADSTAMTAAIDYAIGHGVIFVTVSGNESAGVVAFPGRLPQCITLGGTDRDDTRAAFSNYGSAIDLVAPARDIYTVGMDGTLQYWYGTSLAAPQVSGIAAIIASLDPSITQEKMEKLLCATAQDQVGGASDAPGWDQYFGFGRLNARFAVELGATRAAPPQPINLSSRMRVGNGDRAMIGGFIITGAHAKNTMIRAMGPSLVSANVNGALQNPRLELFDSAGAMIASNDNWGDGQQAELQASGIAPTDSREAAIARILAPGAYTAIVRGVNGEEGVALVEAYDLQQTRNSKLANVSTRGSVGVGDDVMIGGFIIGATSNYVVRAIGPSLAKANVPGALQDPKLELRDGNGTLVAANDDWASDLNAAQVQAVGLAPADSHESATYRTLSAGSYTAVVGGTQDTTGVGLVEVYNVP